MIEVGPLAILGAGGHGRVVADCADVAGWPGICFFDDGIAPPGSLPWPVVGGLVEFFAGPTPGAAIVAIGQNAVRLARHRELVRANFTPAIVVHPRSVVSSHATVGRGSVILAGAVVNFGSRLGEAVIVNTASVVEHDCVLGDGVHLSPGAVLAGGVRIGAESWIGAGAVVREGIVIGSRCRIGAGAIVVKPVDDGQVVVGNPARPFES